MKQFKYVQLANTIKMQIDDGLWLENDKIPSIRELAATHDISKVSVQKALHTLEARDVLFVKNKSGYYVSHQNKEQHSYTAPAKFSKPKLIDIPEVFYEIMERGAAFDISPNRFDHSETSNSLLILNRHISRSVRNNPQNNALYYSEPQGDKALRQQISKHYRKRDINVSDNEICITSGCQNSIFLALTATCNPGDIVAIESPAFYGVLQLLQQLKLKAIELPCSFTQGLAIETLREATNKYHIKACILTANFSTPTGAIVPNGEKQKIVALSAEKNFTIIEDDIYGDLGFHSNTKSLKSFDTVGNVIHCSSFSKSLSRDLRIGWIISQKYYKKIAQLKLIHQLSTSQSIQNGLTSFMSDGSFERHLYQQRKTLLLQRNQLTNSIKAHWQIPTKFTIPDGGLSIWIELPKKVSTISLYNSAVSEGIIITPGGLFTSTDRFSNFFRLSFAHPTTGHRLKAIVRLGEICKEMLRG
ncbi:MAG: PLP-dependent aminotransferase family protein [Colwelliaceae bacterium]|jgi:DNA-binding transcriptional MocR family regulator|nr:PLP-dependent aminotransferase family protein [Colwelliaceae bacterium]